MSKKTAIIKVTPIDRNNMEMDCQTNGISKAALIGSLQVIIKQLAAALVDEARSHVGNDEAAIARWIDINRNQNTSNLN